MIAGKKTAALPGKPRPFGLFRAAAGAAALLNAACAALKKDSRSRGCLAEGPTLSAFLGGVTAIISRFTRKIQKKQKKVIVYIDGLNLYHAIIFLGDENERLSAIAAAGSWSSGIIKSLGNERLNAALKKDSRSRGCLAEGPTLSAFLGGVTAIIARFTRKIRKNRKKAIVYIDGLNLYHAIKRLGDGRLKWLDLQRLAESFLDEGTELAAVKYFTSDIIGEKHRQKWQRQSLYLNALGALPKVSVCKGQHVKKRFSCENCKSNKFACSQCSQRMEIYEEKQTDVSIACELVSDAHEGKFDIAYLVSSDRDFVPAVEKVASMNKIIFMAFPPGRINAELEKAASNCFHIDEQRLSRCLLPLKITTRKKKQITCPQEWQQRPPHTAARPPRR